eukprot:2280181-Prorocentrum_lima.AAC.1
MLIAASVEALRTMATELQHILHLVAGLSINWSKCTFLCVTGNSNGIALPQFRLAAADTLLCIGHVFQANGSSGA